MNMFCKLYSILVTMLLLADVMYLGNVNLQVLVFDFIGAWAFSMIVMAILEARRRFQMTRSYSSQQ